MRIIYQDVTGIMAVVIPSPNWKGTMAELAAKCVPIGVEFEIVADSEIPSDRHFRNAWVKQGKNVKVDVPKARELTKDRLRKEREPLLAQLDTEAMTILEDGGNLSPIKAKKKKLREITDQVDTITSLPQLKNLKAEIT